MKDIVHSFWKKYKKADCLKRTEIIKKIGCFKRIYPVLAASKISDKQKEFIFNHMLQSYFDDLINTMEK